jgi:hypothetical protein
MNEKISILLPTRGRKKLAERFITSVYENSISPNKVEIILYIDEDDVKSQEINVKNTHIIKIIGDRCSMGACNMRCLEEANGQIIVLANDDVVIRTKGWDEKIRLMHRSITDQIYLAYPNDLNKGKNLSAFPILSRKTCELLSQPFPILYRGAFIDTHLMEIFIRLKHIRDNRIRYMEDVVFEHLHFRIGKVEIDQTYKDRDRFADDMIFLSLNKVRKDAAQFLSNVINKKINDYSKFEYTEPFIVKRPSSLIAMIGLSANLYFFDFNLPLKLRIRNFFYYVARWVIVYMKLFR